MAKIRVARLGESVKEMEMPEGATVSDLFGNPEFGDVGESDVRINGSNADQSATLKEEDVVTIVPHIRAG